MSHQRNTQSYTEAVINMSALFYQRISKLMEGISLAVLSGNMEMWYEGLRDLYRNIKPIIEVIRPVKKKELEQVKKNLDLAEDYLEKNVLYRNLGALEFEEVYYGENYSKAYKLLEEAQLSLYKTMQEVNMILPFTEPLDLNTALKNKYT